MYRNARVILILTRYTRTITRTVNRELPKFQVISVLLLKSFLLSIYQQSCVYLMLIKSLCLQFNMYFTEYFTFSLWWLGCKPVPTVRLCTQPWGQTSWCFSGNYSKFKHFENPWFFRFLFFPRQSYIYLILEPVNLWIINKLISHFIYPLIHSQGLDTLVVMSLH